MQYIKTRGHFFGVPVSVGIAITILMGVFHFNAVWAQSNAATKSKSKKASGKVISKSTKKSNSNTGSTLKSGSATSGSSDSGSMTYPLPGPESSDATLPLPTYYNDPSQNSLNSTPTYSGGATAPYASPTPVPEELPIFGGIEVSGQWPAVLSKEGQNFDPGLGLNVGIQLNLISGLRNGISVGFQNHPLVSETNTSFRLIPVLFNTGIIGKTGIDMLYTSFDVGVGGVFGWLNTPNLATIQGAGYFAVQVQPGVEIKVADAVSIFGRMPVLFLFSQRFMGYLAYNGGFRINF